MLATGATPLHWAAWHGMDAVVAQLLAAGAKVDAQDTGGRTAVFGAAGGGYVNVVERLMNHGADVSLKGGRKQETPLDRALQRNKQAVVAILRPRMT
jgi:ankyrin repeat protein